MPVRRVSLLAVALLLGCFADEPAGTGGSSNTAGTTTTSDACVDGELGCACYGNGTCNDGLECAPGAQVCILEDCDNGTLGCTCADGACLSGLSCINQVCAEPPPEGTSTSGAGADSSDGAAVTSATSGEPPDEAVYLFATTATFTPGGAVFVTGDLRTAIDTACATEMLTRVPTCTSATAVFSVSTRDTVADLGATQQLPMDAPLLAPGGTQIAASLQTALDEQQIQTSLVAAGALPKDGSTVSYWTGAGPDGSLDGDTCGDWADPLQAVGAAGTGDGTGPEWLSQDRTCNELRRLLCACW